MHNRLNRKCSQDSMEYMHSMGMQAAVSEGSRFLPSHPLCLSDSPSTTPYLRLLGVLQNHSRWCQPQQLLNHPQMLQHMPDVWPEL